MANPLSKDELDKMKIRVNNLIVRGTALQLGTDIIRELSETGGLGPKSIGDENVDITGIRIMLSTTINQELLIRGAK